MISFLSIVRLTIKNALRSHIFQLLILLLLACIFVIPNTIVGDDTAHGYIQIALKYSLSSVAFVLSLSSIWLGCFLMCSDTENYQLHMVVSKPVSRVVIWLGKYCGILLIHVFLMSFAGVVIYATVLWQFNRQGFSKMEKARIENEVLVGRRVFFPLQPNIYREAVKRLKERNATAAANGKYVDKSPEAQKKMLRMIQNDILRDIGEIKYGSSRIWVFNHLPTDLPKNQPLYLRYRTYVNKVSSEDQRMTRGMWAVWLAATPKGGKKKNAKPQFFRVALSERPEQFMTGVFHEKILPAACIQDNGEVKVEFINFDPKGSGLFFQPKDGPKLLIKVSSFSQNFFRAMIVMFIQLAVLAGLACAAASAMSMPTAVFIVISYLLFGSVATFMAGSGAAAGTASHTLGYIVGRIILTIVIPIQNFEVSPFIANGELIELSYILSIIWKYMILRGLPIYLLGIWLYWRRELGLVIKK